MAMMRCATICLFFVAFALMSVNAYKETHMLEPLQQPETEFEKPIGNQTLNLGREAILTCSLRHIGKNKPRKSVGWLRAEDQTILTMHNRIVSGPRYSVQVNYPWSWQLKIKPLTPEDTGCYICQVNSLPYMISQFGCIEVYVPPDIISDETTNSDVSVQELDNATLTCNATGHPEPNITWRREDHAPILIRKPNQREFDKIETHSGSSLYLWRADRRQMGTFLCIASNEVPPSVSKRVTLYVNFSPTVKVPNQLLGAPLGTDVKLKCYVEAYPNTINYWIKNRGQMLLDGTKFLVTEEKKSYKTTMWLTIKGFDQTDVGTYNCVSTNSLGKSEGTLRLYEIKIAPYSEDYPNQISVAGGLTEASNGNVVTLDMKILILVIFGYVLCFGMMK